MNPAKPYRHLIWDWNGTLMDDAWLCVEVINSILRERDLPTVTLESYRQHFDFPVIRYYERLGFDFKHDTFEAVSHVFIGEYNRRRAECDLHPLGRESLTQLSESGLTHSILSAYQKDTLHEVINHYRITDHFLQLRGLDDIFARGKVDLGHRALETLPFKPEEILLIGDTAHDHEVAQAIGVDCLLVSHGHHHHDRLTKLTPHVVPDMASLLQQLNVESFPYSS